MLWVAAVQGHEEAILKLKWWGEKRSNEFRLMHVSTNSLIAAVNVPKQPSSKGEQRC
jgi:hypothetical protein